MHWQKGGNRVITTVTTTTTVSSAVAMASGLGAVAVIMLIVFLIMKELSSAEVEDKKNSERLRNLASILTVPVVSLLVVFAVIVMAKIWEVL